MNYCQGWIKVGWKKLNKQQELQHCKPKMSTFFLRGMTSKCYVCF